MSELAFTGPLGANAAAAEEVEIDLVVVEVAVLFSMFKGWALPPPLGSESNCSPNDKSAISTSVGKAEDSSSTSSFSTWALPEGAANR